MAFEVDPGNLIRKPLSASRLPAYTNTEVRYFPSPNEKVALACSHDFEPRMGANCFLFKLLDRDGRILHRFEPMLGEGKRNCCAWSPDSARFAMTIHFRKPAIFVYDLETNCFTVMPFANTYQISLSLVDHVRLRVTFDSDQVPRETKFVLGLPEGNENTSISELVHVPYHAPSRRYRAPEPLTLQLDQTRWFSWSDYATAEQYVSALKMIPFSPIFEGFYPYGGPFPNSTKDLMVCRMIDFADYGDPQCKIWTDVLHRKTRGTFSRWESAHRYLGVRTRELPAPKRDDTPTSPSAGPV